MLILLKQSAGRIFRNFWLFNLKLQFRVYLKFSELKKAAKKEGEKIGILFLDIDEFKKVNDNFGHDIGDRLLEEIANRLEDSLEGPDNLARLGGDEFVMALSDISSREQVIKIARRLIEKFKDPLLIEGEQIAISVSGGISIYPEDGRKLEDLIKNADFAMYQAKRKQKDLEVNQEQGE